MRSVNTSGKSQQLAKSSKIDNVDFGAPDSHFIGTLDPQLRDLDAAENQAKESTVDDQELAAQSTISDEELNKTAFQGDVDEDGVAALVDNVDKDVAMLGGDANTFVMTFVKYNVVIRSSKGLLKRWRDTIADSMQEPCPWLYL